MGGSRSAARGLRTLSVGHGRSKLKIPAAHDGTARNMNAIAVLALGGGMSRRDSGPPAAENRRLRLHRLVGEVAVSSVDHLRRSVELLFQSLPHKGRRPS